MRRVAAARYRELLALAGAEITVPYQPTWARPVYHLFVVRVQDRDELIKRLALVGIGVGIHYPIPLHLQKAYEFRDYEKGDFPVAEKLSTEVLSLPMFPELTADQQCSVAREILSFVAAKSRTFAGAR